MNGKFGTGTHEVQPGWEPITERSLTPTDADNGVQLIETEVAALGIPLDSSYFVPCDAFADRAALDPQAGFKADVKSALEKLDENKRELNKYKKPALAIYDENAKLRAVFIIEQ